MQHRQKKLRQLQEELFDYFTKTTQPLRSSGRESLGSSSWCRGRQDAVCIGSSGRNGTRDRPFLPRAETASRDGGPNSILVAWSNIEVDASASGVYSADSNPRMGFE